jgi:hypothetical protein
MIVHFLKVERVLGVLAHLQISLNSWFKHKNSHFQWGLCHSEWSFCNFVAKVQFEVKTQETKKYTQWLGFAQI